MHTRGRSFSRGTVLIRFIHFGASHVCLLIKGKPTATWTFCRAKVISPRLFTDRYFSLPSALKSLTPIDLEFKRTTDIKQYYKVYVTQHDTRSVLKGEKNLTQVLHRDLHNDRKVHEKLKRVEKNEIQWLLKKGNIAASLTDDRVSFSVNSLSKSCPVRMWEISKSTKPTVASRVFTREERRLRRRRSLRTSVFSANWATIFAWVNVSCASRS